MTYFKALAFVLVVETSTFQTILKKKCERSQECGLCIFEYKVVEDLNSGQCKSAFFMSCRGTDLNFFLYKNTIYTSDIQIITKNIEKTKSLIVFRKIIELKRH